ncbi:1,2-dihydroxy-3-keto-5-methylthiopentene dioxygenase [Mycena sanguinolenta]|uniref:acireductone dioxygenase (Fe(2+)-requiring) n=1 Tax=Mycena sanguinolenta TaxID=230812 RepID=A0A8H7CZW6_9AGAR|nr:1,2-dihydroxy-3-keto-5-methylthiopentene dioxygenase [Mycena sanguinolenta]
MHVYYYDNLPTDQRLLHITDPFDGHENGVDEADDTFEVNRVAKERGYKNRDVINVSREGMGSVYEEKIRGFFEKHTREDEEPQPILSGGGLFDVRGAASPPLQADIPGHLVRVVCPSRDDYPKRGPI